MVVNCERAFYQIGYYVNSTEKWTKIKITLFTILNLLKKNLQIPNKVFYHGITISDGHGKKNNSRPTTASGKNPQPTTV